MNTTNIPYVSCSALALLVVLLVANSLSAQQLSWWPSSGKPAEDFAVCNVGQVKNMATSCAFEFERKLPGGSGPEIRNMVSGWASPPVGATARDDFAVASLGMLKAVAQPFYDRLIPLRLCANPPWVGTGKNADDFAAANLGQLKAVFNIVLTVLPDTNANGIADAFEYNFFKALISDRTAAPAGDGVSIYVKYLAKANPTAAAVVVPAGAASPLNFRVFTP